MSDQLTISINCTATKFLELDQLTPFQGNLKNLSTENYARLKKVILREGFISPFHVWPRDGKFYLLDGHQRHRVLTRMRDVEGYKIPALPVTEIEARTEKQAKQKLLALTSQYGEMTAEGLLEFAHEFDLDELTDAFRFPEIDLDSLERPVLEGNTQEDEVPEVTESICKLGDLWQLGNHRLLCGDSTIRSEVDRLMGGDKADMVFTDPPYGVSYQDKNKTLNRLQSPKGGLETPIHGDDLSVEDLKVIIQAVFNNIDAVLADKSSYYVCSPQGGELGLMMMMMMAEANIPCRHMIIWVKNAPVFSIGRLDYDYKHEPILFGWSPNRTHHKATHEGEWKSSVWDCDREPNKLHPTMKPVALPVNAIINSCPRDGRVIDLFSGSGSTLIACEKTKRKCYGMEIDPHYCDVIIKRWEDYTGKKAVLSREITHAHEGRTKVEARPVR